MLNGRGIISELQKTILLSFGALKDADVFHLARGTALAEFYLAHRRSYDIDLFAAEEGIIIPVSRLFENTLSKTFVVAAIRRFNTFVEYEVGKGEEKTRVQLALDSPFTFEPAVDSVLGVKVSSYKDIIADKLLAFFGRAEPRDAVDIYFIFKNEDIWALAEMAAKKDPGFDLYWLAVSLQKVRNFPDTIEDWPIDLIIHVEAKEIKKLFSDLSVAIMEKIQKRT